MIAQSPKRRVVDLFYYFENWCFRFLLIANFRQVITDMLGLRDLKNTVVNLSFRKIQTRIKYNVNYKLI